jgi:hypothetical protein
MLLERLILLTMTLYFAAGARTHRGKSVAALHTAGAPARLSRLHSTYRHCRYQLRAGGLLAPLARAFLVAAAVPPGESMGIMGSESAIVGEPFHEPDSLIDAILGQALRAFLLEALDDEAPRLVCLRCLRDRRLLIG